MRLSIVICAAIVLSCVSKEEKAISEKVQSLKMGKLDLDFKMKSLDIKKYIKGIDSVSEIDREIKYWEEKTKSHFTSKIESFESDNRFLDIDLKYPSLKKNYNEAIQKKRANFDSIAFYQSLIKDVQDRVYTDSEFKNLKIKRDYYQQNSEVVFGKETECVYSIINPILKIKQEVRRYFWFNNVGKIVGASDDLNSIDR